MGILSLENLAKVKGGYFLTEGELAMNKGGQLYSLVNRLKGERKLKVILSTEPDITGANGWDMFLTYQVLKSLGLKESDEAANEVNEFDYLAGEELISLESDGDEFAKDDWALIDNYDEPERELILKHFEKGILDYNAIGCGLWEDANWGCISYSENTLIPIFVETARYGYGPIRLIFVFDGDEFKIEKTDFDPESGPDESLFPDDFFEIMDEHDIEDYI